MSETDELAPGAPAPVIRKRSGPSLVWIIPFVVAVVGGWLIAKTLSEKGPVLSVSFKTAQGIEAGKTKLRYKNIEVGLVETVRFSDDFSHVLLTAQMAQDTENFARRGTRFWVVRPRLTARGVSGLGTLVSGAYIEVEPGAGAEQRHFQGLEVPPIVGSDEEGERITLISDRLGSIGIGSPISYRGIGAGEVLGHELATDRRSVLIYAFVKSPFDQLLRGNTRFWNVSGVDVTLNSEGLSVRTESMQSIIFGGIAFQTPEDAEPVKPDLSDVVFTLFRTRKDIAEKSFTKRVRFVMFFDGSVRGLNVDAPVEFKGIKVGAVVDVRLEFDPRDTTFRIPVLIEIEPERIIARGQGASRDSTEVLRTLVERGLRARLTTGNLLTGQLFVELDLHPNTPIKLVNAGGPYPELPTIPASLQEITASVKGVLEKINKLDFEEINEQLVGALAGANKLANAPEFKTALNELESALSTFRAMAGRIDRRVDPLMDGVEEAIVDGRAALKDARGTLKLVGETIRTGRVALKRAQDTLSLVDTVLKSDSPLQRGYIELADVLTETARSIKSFVDMLSRNPDAFIFGK